ncbi:MAG: GIY-YIG nuclease family protein [Planctomycetota bacterium]|jgi:putative endonuclease|nr:GIY-YIG nuclease family protein [Planctomycetota bacterium]
MEAPSDSGPCAYLLRCGDGTLYAGAAKDLAQRIATHQAGKGARYTRARLPVALAWYQACDDWSAALKREYQLKRLGKSAKEALVRAGLAG